MKYILKDKAVIIVNNRKNIRIIINFNDNINEMTLNTMLSIREINDKKINNKCFIINSNRYIDNNKVITNCNIKNPYIIIYNLNINKYIKSISNKHLINFEQKDRIAIIFSAKNINEIFKFIKTTKNIDEEILKLVI